MILKVKSQIKGILVFGEKPRVREIVSLVLALSVFTLILLNRSPNILRPISLYLRTGFNFAVILFFLLLYASFRLRGWLGELLSLTLTLALFAFALAGLWAIGQTQPSIFNGIVPLADAGDYYSDALRLISGQDFSVFSARRPLFPGLLSVALSVVGHNLMGALGVLTLITAIACYIVTREIQKNIGTEAAVFVLIILFLFYRHHSGSVMSENLGVPLGALGFALLWRGTVNKESVVVCGGLFVITLALNARAGAFFMLPLLLLWGGWIFKSEVQKFSWHFFMLGSVVVISAFVVNLLMVRLLATPSGVPFANFSYSLYGLASGGKSWIYVFESHPELYALQEPFQSREIYRMAFDLIRNDPLMLVKGALFNWSMLFSDSWYSAYSFVGGENRIAQDVAQWIIYVLCILGFVRWVCNPHDPLISLVGIAAIGVLISVPFMPPTDAYRMRPYAVSMIVFGLLPAMGLLFGAEILRLRLPAGPSVDTTSEHSLPIFTIFLILITLTGPLVVKASGELPKFESVACESGQELVSLRFDSGTQFSLVRQDAPGLDWMPVFHISRFRRGAHNLPDSDMIQWAEKIEPATSMFVSLDYRTMKDVLIVTPTNLLPRPNTLWQVCGRWETESILYHNNVFTVQNTASAP